MKWFAPLWLFAAFLPACRPGMIQEMRVDRPAPIQAQKVRYDADFVATQADDVCTEWDSEQPWWSFTGQPHQLLSVRHGGYYVVSPSVSSGSFGSFHYAHDEAGKLWGVKQVYTAPPTDVLDAFRRRVEGTVEDEDLRRELGLWQLLGPDSAVREVLSIDEEGRRAVVMALMDGDVGSLFGGFAQDGNDDDLTPPQRSILARSVMSQVSRNAQALHELGYVHNDLRPGNIFWHRDGRIILADYGLAFAVESDGCLERAPWQVVQQRNVGNLVAEFVAAPEVLSSRYNAKADSWSLGLAVLDVLVPSHDFGGQVGYETLKNPIGFASWRATLTDAAGNIDLDAIQDPQLETVPARYYMFHQAFHTAKQTDPELTRLLLEHLLVSEPDERWDMGQIQGAMAAPARAQIAALLSTRGRAALESRAGMVQKLQTCAESLFDD